MAEPEPPLSDVIPPLTILLVDDSEDDQRLYRRALRDRPCRIASALSGEDGLAQVRSLRPDVILLDYSLPDLSGLDFLGRLDQDTALSVPVIMLTGQGNESVAVQAMKAGASDYLVKDTSGGFLRLLPSVIDRVIAARAEIVRSRQLAALHEAILGTVADGIVGIDAGGCVRFANPSAIRLLQATAGGLVGLHFGAFLRPVPTTMNGVQHPLVRPHDGRNTLSRDSDHFQRPDGTTFPVSYTASPIDFAADGKVGWVLAFRNITQRKQVEQDRSRFIAAVAHDLYQPLKACRLLLESAQEMPLQDAARSVVGKACRATEVQTELLNQLMDYTSVERGAVTPVCRDVAVWDVVAPALDLFRSAAADKGVSLHGVACSAEVRGDPALLRRMVMNLVNNAVRFTDRGRVLVGCRRAGDGLWIEVHDQGRGIAPDTLAAILAGQGTTPSGPDAMALGLGIGLRVVLGLAQVLDHRLDAGSVPGKGSCFRFLVPLSSGYLEFLRAGGVDGLVAVLAPVSEGTHPQNSCGQNDSPSR